VAAGIFALPATKLKKIRKKIAEVKTYILTGLR
jgi:hypothetical protein